MICKKKKNKYIYVFLLSLILVCGLLQSSALSCNSYASNTVTVGDYLNSQDFYDTCAWYFRKIGSIPDGVGGGTTFTYNAFADYLESKDKSYLLSEPVTVIDPETNNASGGRGYDLPQEARQEIINYVNENVVEANPLSYVQCSISSYNYLDASRFPSYGMYNAVKEYMKSHDGYHVIQYIGTYGSAVTECRICTISHDNNLGFIGTVNSGIFNQVRLYKDWVSNFNVTGIMFNASGSQVNTSTQNVNFNLHNTNAFEQGNIFTSYPKNEIVYVFQTLNAYKNYNAGTPQPYYLLSEPDYIAPYSDPITYDDSTKAGNFYNSIVNNVNTGDTPDQVQKTVKNGLLGNLVDTLTGSNSSTALDVGNFDTSFLGTIKDLVLGVTGAIDPAEQLVNTDLKRFVTDIFGWLPAEIVTFWIAGILFAVLFGVLRIIRG